MTSYSWIAVDALTGKKWGDLPDFFVDTVSLIIGQTQTETGTYPISSDSTPTDWLLGTVPWSVAVLLIADDAADPLGGWYINQRVRDQGDTLSIPLVSGEGYFERRYVGSPGPFNSVDQNTVAASLVSAFAVAPPSGSSGLSGLPMIINVVGGAGNKITRTNYLDVNDQTLSTALQELMGVQGGPEYTVTWRHLSNPERYFPVFNVGTRIGSPVTAGLGPQAVFEMGGTSEGGSVTSAVLTEDYSSGKGANFVTATGMTLADGTRPQQSASAADVRRPALEYRWNPSTSITDSATLLAHALQTIPLMKDGSRALTLSTIASEGPIFGRDWFMGDTVGYSIGGLVDDPRMKPTIIFADIFSDIFLDTFGTPNSASFPTSFPSTFGAANEMTYVKVNPLGIESVPAFPGGLKGQARVVGVQFQPDVPTPIFTPILAGV
jgi:hypothetical protein